MLRKGITLAKDAVRWCYWFPVRLVLRLLPLGAVWHLAGLLGRLRPYLSPGSVRVLEGVLARCDLGLTPERRKVIARRSFLHATLATVETLSFDRLDRDWVESSTSIVGEEHLQNAMEKGQGALLLVAHLGANQLLMSILGHRGYVVNQLGAKPDTWHRLVGKRPNVFERAIFRLRHRLEQHLPATFLYLEQSMRPAFRCLQRNEILIMALEGRAGAHWEKVSFLGRQANLAAGPMFIARRVNAPVLPCAVVRGEDGTFTLHLLPPVAVERGATREEAWREELATVCEALTPLIQAHPEQYGTLLLEAHLRANLDEVPLFDDDRSATIRAGS